MKCDGCKKNEAHLVLHMITNGQVATRSLCMECAKKAHEEMTQAFSILQNQFGVFESAVIKIGLARTKPYRNIMELKLK